MSTSVPEPTGSEPSLGDLCECLHTRAGHVLNTDTGGQHDGQCLIGHPDGCECDGFVKVGSVPVDKPPVEPTVKRNRTWAEVKKELGLPPTQVEHPGDLCTCGHPRSQHCDDPEENDYCQVPGTGTASAPFADDCEHFELDKTALQVAVDTAEEANLNEYSESADCITQPSEDEQVLCEECGHDDSDHDHTFGCLNVGCNCAVGMDVPEPELHTDPTLNPYRVTFAVNGGQTYEIDIPGDFSVIAVDGILKVYTPGRPVLGIVSVRQYPNLPED